MVNNKSRPLIKWYGGKTQMASLIAGKLPAHEIYLEPFGGSAAVLMAKTPSKIEIYNDLHSGVVNLFRVVRDQSKAEQLIELLNCTPYSREEWRFCEDNWENETDEIKKAWLFYVATNQSFIGATSGSSWGLGSPKKFGDIKPKVFNKSIENIRLVTNRFKTVYIENYPALELMKKWDSQSTTMYIDPPYVTETRVSKAAYKYELTQNQHLELLDFITRCKSKIVLSGYSSELYSDVLDKAGWEREDYPVTLGNSAARRSYKEAPEKSDRIECLWFSPNARTRTLWDLE